MSHPRAALGGRSIDYRHLLVPPSRKPQALRQVNVEELGRCAWIPTARNVVQDAPIS